MWGDLMMAVSTAVVPCPFHVMSTSNEMSMYIRDPKRKELEKFRVSGLVIDGTQEARGKVLGIKSPRRNFIGDEAEDINDIIYEVMTNITGAISRRVMLLSNPREKDSGFGKFNEPACGWSSVSEHDTHWATKNGGICLHFNGLHSPNVKAGKSIFTGIITKEQVEDIRTVNKENSVAWYSRVLGFPAPDGMVSRIFTTHYLNKAKNTIEWDFKPEPCATLDPAYEKDAAPMHFGEIGKMRDGKLGIQGTETIVMRYQIGEPKHYQLAHWVMQECKKRGVKPKNFIMDASGNASGTRDILMKEWSKDVQWICYGGAATERTIIEGTMTKACDKYEKFVTELWFRAAECAASGTLMGLGRLHEKTEQELAARLYEEHEKTEGLFIVAEKKEDMKKRLGHSPDYADAFCQFGELLVRSRMGEIAGLPVPTKTRWSSARERASAINAVHAEYTNT